VISVIVESQAVFAIQDVQSNQYQGEQGLLSFLIVTTF
jgi:hypothetical protein